jgi:hypothetical protein
MEANDTTSIFAVYCQRLNILRAAERDISRLLGHKYTQSHNTSTAGRTVVMNRLNHLV